MCIVMIATILSVAFPSAFALGGEVYYIDSVSGDNANTGTSPSSPWKTLVSFSGEKFNPGDKILFKCGGTYDCSAVLTDVSGTKEKPIVISSYGEGDKPILTTDKNTEILTLIDCSYITLSDLELTAPNGGGIWIDTLGKTSEGISLDNLYFHSMPNGKVNSRDDFSRGAAAARAAVMVKGLPARSRYAVNDLTISNCEVYDCANGFIIWGSWNDEQNPWCEPEEEDPIYNEGVLIEGCYLHEMDAEAVVIGMCDGALVTDCRAINCCQGEGVDENGKVLYYTAAMWFWGSENSTFQYCEIAGQKNVGDGMTVDFDSQSNNCTYQYIYSHDNNCFMVNNAKTRPQQNNTVRYCLSVNDNGKRSSIASGAGESGLNFYNNTIVNCGEFQIYHLTNSLFVNNIIIPMDGKPVVYDLRDELTANNVFANNCYYNSLKPMIDALSMNADPGFAIKNGEITYELAADSPLIGKGCYVDDGLEYDFFGNKIESHNIGCYSGTGEISDTEYVQENLSQKLSSLAQYVFERLIHELKVAVREAIDFINIHIIGK